MPFLCIILLLFLFYIPLFVVLSLRFALMKRGYSFLKGDVSDLGREAAGLDDELFNLLVFLFSVFNIALGLKLYWVLHSFTYSKIAIGFFFLGDFSMLLVSFFPENKRRRAHRLTGEVLFFALANASLFFIPVVLASEMIPDLLSVINGLIVILAALFGVSQVMIWKKLVFPHLLSRMIEGRGVWEWSVFFLSLAWAFVASASLLKNTCPPVF